MKLFLLLIGMVLVIEGLPYVAAPEAMQKWLRQLIEIPPSQLRIIGLIAMGSGFAILFLTRGAGVLP